MKLPLKYRYLLNRIMIYTSIASLIGLVYIAIRLGEMS